MATVNGDTLEAAYRGARDLIRGEIIANDVLSIEKENIVRGEGLTFTKEWRGTQGFVSWDYYNGENRSEWAWATGMFKTANVGAAGSPDPSTEMGMLYQKDPQDVWGACKTFTLDQNAVVRIFIQADVYVQKTSAWGAIDRHPGFDGGYPSPVWLRLEGYDAPSTYSYHWEELPRFPLGSGEKENGITDNNPDPSWIRRSYTTWYYEPLQRGTWNVKLMVDPRCERIYFARRFIMIEATHTA